MEALRATLSLWLRHPSWTLAGGTQEGEGSGFVSAALFFPPFFSLFYFQIRAFVLRE